MYNNLILSTYLILSKLTGTQNTNTYQVKTQIRKHEFLKLFTSGPKILQS